MKIEFNIKTDTVLAANKVLKELWELPVSLNQREKVYRSIGYDLAEKFDKKCKTLIKKASLFDNDRIKMTLKYHEAWALELILKDLMYEIIKNNEYQLMLLESFTGLLNQKLS